MIRVYNLASTGILEMIIEIAFTNSSGGQDDDNV